MATISIAESLKSWTSDQVQPYLDSIGLNSLLYIPPLSKRLWLSGF